MEKASLKIFEGTDTIRFEKDGKFVIGAFIRGDCRLNEHGLAFNYLTKYDNTMKIIDIGCVSYDTRNGQFYASITEKVDDWDRIVWTYKGTYDNSGTFTILNEEKDVQSHRVRKSVGGKRRKK